MTEQTPKTATAAPFWVDWELFHPPPALLEINRSVRYRRLTGRHPPIDPLPWRKPIVRAQGALGSARKAGH